MPTTDPRVDAYIEQAAPFARPILTAVRAAFHAGCPELVETIKWGHPSFEHQGMLGGMAAFKRHATFGFWRSKEMEDPAGILGESPTASPMCGHYRELNELPSKQVLVSYVKQAVRLNAAGAKPARVPKPKAKRPAPPRWFLDAVAAVPAAQATWDKLTPGYRHEYVEWVTEAKREATRERRVAQAVEWLSEGKTRNWKYKGC